MSKSQLLIYDFFLQIMYRLPSAYVLHAVEVVAAVADTIALVVGVLAGFIAGVLAGFIAGVLIYHCISNHRSQSCKPEPSSHQQWQAGPVYEQLSAEKLDLRENVAYGSVKTCQAYGHLQH